MNISVVIPNYNGESILRQNLPKVVAALQFLPKGKKELIITDDNSQDSSLEILRELKETLKSNEIDFLIVETSVNKGFSSTVNRGVKIATGDILILLNTDVAPDKESFYPLLKHFTDPKVFAVGCMDRSIEEHKEILRGRGLGRWERGFLMHSRGENISSSTLWVSGGSGAFRRSIWNILGGLDEIYNPFYWEDIDLSYRAMKSGYKILFEAESIVTHEHEKGAIKKKFTSDQIRKVVFRNQLTFVWKNITDGRYLISHLLWLPYHLLKALLRQDTVFIVGFLMALKRLPRILKNRSLVKILFVLSDKEVIQHVTD